MHRTFDAEIEERDENIVDSELNATPAGQRIQYGRVLVFEKQRSNISSNLKKVKKKNFLKTMQ